MKKSTLITTIAMIVVVVVALSTATYAWFSSATTTSASDTITTVAASEWVIMGGTATHDTVDNVTYSSSTSIALTMLDGLYSPNAVLNGSLNSASNSATFTAQSFFTATQDGTGLSETAQAKDVPSIDPLGNNDEGKVSAVNYVRIIRTGSAASNLVLTITVVTEGTKDSDFYAANGFNTYVAWYKAGNSDNTGSANTSYYWGTVDGSATTGTGDGYYAATINSTTPVNATGVTYQQNIDHNNVGARGGSIADPSTNYATLDADHTLTIGTEVLNSGRYYQIKVPIATSMAQNSAVNIAFYAWFDGWAIDNTGSNSGATVYYEFGNS